MPQKVGKMVLRGAVRYHPPFSLKKRQSRAQKEEGYGPIREETLQPPLLGRWVKLLPSKKHHLKWQPNRLWSLLTVLSFNLVM